MNPKDRDVSRDYLVLQDVNMSFADVLFGYFRDRGGLRDFLNENQHSENHACFYSDRQIRKDRKQESGKPSGNFHPRELERGGFLLVEGGPGGDREMAGGI